VTATSDAPLDYYAVLQVRPDADQAVIAASYRALIKQHHPDLAGDDPERIKQHLARTKVLIEAYSVLGDPPKRKQYDDMLRIRGRGSASTGYAPGSQSTKAGARPTGTPQGQGARPSSPPPPAADPAARPGDATRASAPRAQDASVPAQTVIVPPQRGGLPGPLALIGAAYYLLPGPYEWEEGSRKELLAVGLLPFAGLASFALLTGRLEPWIGHSFNATLLAWGLIVLLFLPMLTSLPRVAMAGGPSLLLLTGLAAPMLAQYHVPVWFAWGMASLFSVVLAARLFVFGVLPTVAACWLITQIS
jgi:hypothetical protein